MAKTAYFNGIIYTAEAGKATAEAFVVEDGRFGFVGKNEDLPQCETRVDLEGKCVIPGLIDSHCHFLAGVTQGVTSMIFVDEDTTPERLGKVLENLVSKSGLPADSVVAAMGIDLTLGEFCAGDIDCTISNRPVIVFSGDGHGLLLNSAAMKLIGINKDTPDPSPDSYYKRDKEGNPTGLVIEIPAMMPCKVILPEPSIKDFEEIIPGIAAKYAALGYTTVFDAMSAYGDKADEIESLSHMDKEEGLPLRICLSFGYHGEEIMKAEDVVEMMKKCRERFSTDNVSLKALKMITDGTIEERTALLYEPYSDDGKTKGSDELSFEEMTKAAGLAAKAGFDIHIHAIGDMAVGRAIDVLDSLGKISGTKTIAHNQVYTEADIERMIKAGDIVFQTTPQWMTADVHTKKCLGPDRFLKQFPVGTMQRAGICVAFGSDSCLEPDTANAFAGMYYACTRGDDKLLGEISLPPSSESITRMESLFAYTINGAGQLGLSDETGSISKGKSADFVILDRDIINCPIEDLPETKVLDTFFRGNKV